MPCPHNEISIVQRSQQQSAVAAAAYQSGEKLFCGYDQEVKHYPEKRGIVHNEILLPANAPRSYADRNTLWSAAEAVEKQFSHRRTGAPGADEKCPYPLLAEATAPQAIPQAGKGGCKAERGCGGENCHSHRTPDRPGSGICQKSSCRCRDCGALCVTPVCYAVLFLYYAYAGERWGRCIRSQHLSLRGS